MLNFIVILYKFLHHYANLLKFLLSSLYNRKYFNRMQIIFYLKVRIFCNNYFQQHPLVKFAYVNFLIFSQRIFQYCFMEIAISYKKKKNWRITGNKVSCIQIVRKEAIKVKSLPPRRFIVTSLEIIRRHPISLTEIVWKANVLIYLRNSSLNGRVSNNIISKNKNIEPQKRFT